jgi:hypothetical protein
LWVLVIEVRGPNLIIELSNPSPADPFRGRQQAGRLLRATHGCVS